MTIRIGMAVAVGLAVGWAICRFNGDTKHRREHVQELAPSSGALAEWKGIWDAGNPMPPLVTKPVGEKSASSALPIVPPLLKVGGLAKSLDASEARLERLLEKLEQIETRLLGQLDKIAKDSKASATGRTLPSGFNLEDLPQHITTKSTLDLLAPNGTSDGQNGSGLLGETAWMVEILTRLFVQNPLEFVMRPFRPTEGAGMTLESGFYLEHPPQYIPPSPAFPLKRDLARQEVTANRPEVVSSLGNSSRCLLESIGASFGSPSLLLLRLCANQLQQEQHNSRINQLIKQSEDLRRIQDDWERIWFPDPASALTPYRVSGHLQ